MLRFKDARVSPVLVGLHRVGIVGLRDALKKAAESGLSEREEIVDFLLDTLAAENYIPDPQDETYRIALWREHLRFKGENIQDLFSEIEVTVHGEAGQPRDEFVATLRAAIAHFELKPVVSYAPAREDGPNPQLVIHDETVARGPQSRRNLQKALQKTISGW